VTGAGHTAGELIFDLHFTYRNGGRTYAYIRRPGDIVPVGALVLGVEGMPEDRDTGRTMVAGFNSYVRHFGPRAVEAAEGDLLGLALEALRPFAEACAHLHPSHPDDGETMDGFKVSDFRHAAAILSQAQAREVTR